MNANKFPHGLLFLFLLPALLLGGCTRKASVLATFVGNKEHRDAALFLAEHQDGHYGLRARYTNDGENDLNETINNHLGKGDIVDSLSAYRTIDTLWDREHVRTDHIIENTRLAFRHYRENPFGMNVPDSIFREYILPYRVGHEKITGNWRVHFNKLYGNYLKGFDGEKDEDFVNRMVTEIQRLSFHPYDHSGLAGHPISPEVSFDEIREVAHPYSCEDYAMFKLYSYRALGLAAAYEVVPLYGKFNHGHAETALFHRDGSFHCTEGSTEMPYKYQIAKMYRRRFSKKESPYQKILSLGEREENIPDYFDMPYYEDITRERTIVSDIMVSDGQIGGTTGGVLYICVYNNGEWKPVEWSARNTETNLWTFRDMGRKNIYHLSFYEDGLQHLLGNPMVLDTAGNVRDLILREKGLPEKHTLQKYDRNKNISEGKFKLYLWENKRWNRQGVFSANGSELSLALAENVLYKLEKNETNTRPFCMENGKQIWW